MQSATPCPHASRRIDLKRSGWLRRNWCRGVGGVLGRACSTYIFHRVFRWLQDQRGQRAQLELRFCRGGEKQPFEFGVGTEAATAESDFTHLEPHRSPKATTPSRSPSPALDRTPPGPPAPGAPAPASPPSFFIGSQEPAPLLRPPPRAGNAARASEARPWGETPQTPKTAPHPESRGHASRLTDTSLLATKNQVWVMFSHSSRSRRPPEAPGTSARPLTPPLSPPPWRRDWSSKAEVGVRVLRQARLVLARSNA